MASKKPRNQFSDPTGIKIPPILIPREPSNYKPPAMLGYKPDPRAVEEYVSKSERPVFSYCSSEIKGTGAGKTFLGWKYLELLCGGTYPTLHQAIGDCFAAGTPVPGEYTKMIEDVRVGDRVFTPDGKLTKVISTRKKMSKKRMVTIRGLGSLPIVCTEDHKFLVYRLPKVKSKRITARRYAAAVAGRGSAGDRVVIDRFEARTPVWVAAGELKDTDYLLSPSSLQLPEDQTRGGCPVSSFVAGYFAGNGHASSGSVELTGPGEKTWICDELCRQLRRDGFDPKVSVYQERDAWRVRIHSVDLVDWCRSNLYAEDGSKLMPLWALTDSEFIDGLKSSDGFEHDGSQFFDSTSKSLAFGFYLAMCHQGLCPSISTLHRSEGTYENAKTLYRVIVKENPKRGCVWSDGKYVCRPVVSLKFHDKPMEVYDIGVEDESHAFLAAGVAAHNCVSFGWAGGVDNLRAAQIVRGGLKEQLQALTATEPIYGGSRFEIGGNNRRAPFNGDGSNGVWAADYLKKYGILLRQPYPGGHDFTNYSGTKARQYGARGVPNELESIAREHPVITASLVQSYEEIRDALANGYFVVVCSNIGFGPTGGNVRDAEGFLKRRGNWGHCMLFIAINDNYKRPCVLCVNSWGRNWISGPKRLGQPDGSFWIDADTIDVMARQGDTFAISDLRGFLRKDDMPHVFQGVDLYITG